ncbi:MAG: AGE family epimerase/isomerase [Pirellulaceae bacterium]|nr:AGE family epimerase/isomerase [Pirellulaceae bacterium]
MTASDARLDPNQSEALAQFYRNTLLNDVLPFWFPRSVDQRHGGFYHCYDADGTLVDTDKSVWAQGRMAWMLLTLYNTWEPRREWFEWGQQGIEFLLRHGFDQDGRMHFTLTQDGRSIRKRRYAYSESFLSIASAALFRATQDQQWRDLALKLFRFFVHWNFTPGQMPPKFSDTRPLTGIGPRMIALTTAQSLRSDLGENAELTKWIDRCLFEIETLFVKHEHRVVMETVTPEGEISDHFDGRLLNPGHAIEAAWFVMDEGVYRKNQHWIDLGCQMLEYSWQRGWDQEFGGLFYFRDVYNRPVSEYWHDMKFWWPHNEAIIATLIAWKLTGRSQFGQWHKLVHDWSFQHFADPQHGEWFGYLHRDGRRSNSLKGNHWKSFFHHPRMLWKCVQVLERKSPTLPSAP